MLKRMNSKSTQNTWCYRYKLLSWWISSIDILVFFTFIVFWKRVSRIRLYRGGVGGKAKAYFWVQGWMAPCLYTGDMLVYLTDIDVNKFQADQ